MIFSGSGREAFFIDILIHSFFSYIILLIVFFIINSSILETDLEDTVIDAFDSDLLDGYTDLKPPGINGLAIVYQIYTDRDKTDDELNREIEKATFMQLVVFTWCFILIMIIINKNFSYYKHFFADKVITFTIFTCSIYLINYYIDSEYTNFYIIEAYEILKKRLRNLTPHIHYLRFAG